MAKVHQSWAWQQLRRARLQAAIRAGEPCWRCGLPIDYGLPGTHPHGPHLDHVRPVALYPALALDPGNTRWAHRVCNERAGASLGGRIVAAKGAMPQPRRAQGGSRVW
jgi:5-methylcytosine-specific restriction endonuclease McrA